MSTIEALLIRVYCQREVVLEVILALVFLISSCLNPLVARPPGGKGPNPKCREPASAQFGPWGSAPASGRAPRRPGPELALLRMTRLRYARLRCCSHRRFQLAGVMSGLYTVMPPGIYGSILVVSSSTAHMLGSPHIGAAALQSAS